MDDVARFEGRTRGSSVRHARRRLRLARPRGAPHARGQRRGVRRAAAARAGARVLDCAAGTGPLAVGLALRGFDVVATDASEAMIARTRSLATERGVELPARVCTWEEPPGAADVRCRVLRGQFAPARRGPGRPAARARCDGGRPAPRRAVRGHVAQLGDGARPRLARERVRAAGRARRRPGNDLGSWQRSPSGSTRKRSATGSTSASPRRTPVHRKSSGRSGRTSERCPSRSSPR